MGLSADQLRTSLDALAGIEPKIAAAVARVGYPEPRIRDRGYATLLRTIVGQQVSAAAAQAIWNKLEAGLGDLDDPATIATSDLETLRTFGLSRQKGGYALSLADEVTSVRLDLDRLPDRKTRRDAAVAAGEGGGIAFTDEGQHAEQVMGAQADGQPSRVPPP